MTIAHSLKAVIQPRPVVTPCWLLLACTLLSGLIIHSPSAAAQSATLQGDILTLPAVVLDSGLTYRAEMRLLQGSATPTLELLEAIPIPTNSISSTNSYSNNRLVIPDLQANDRNYWAELMLQSDNRFLLKDSGPRTTIGSSNQMGISFQPSWQRLVGEAADIGVGADGTAWVIGTDERRGGFGIYRLQGDTWARVSGGAVRIDVDAHGDPWIVNNSHEIYKWNGNDWLRLPGDARDIGVGADGSVWVVSGGGVYQWNGIGWDRTSGSAVRVDVTPNGIPWVIDHTNDIYELIAGRWIRRPGLARDVGIGADGSVWIIGTSRDDSSHGIYRWDGNDWKQVEGSARQVSVGPDGSPWVSRNDGDIYRGH